MSKSCQPVVCATVAVRISHFRPHSRDEQTDTARRRMVEE